MTENLEPTNTASGKASATTSTMASGKASGKPRVKPTPAAAPKIGRPRKTAPKPPSTHKPAKTPPDIKLTKQVMAARMYMPMLIEDEVVPELASRARAANGRLPYEIHRLIVELNACRRTPNEVAQFLREHTGFEVTRQECEYYDPTKRAGAGLRREWRELFWHTRRAYDEQQANVNMSQLTWRLDQLQWLYDEEIAKPRPNVPLCMELLAQAAREMNGGSGRRAAVETPPPPVLTNEEKIARAVRTMARVVKEQQERNGTSSLMTSLPEKAQRVIETINSGQEPLEE